MKKDMTEVVFILDRSGSMAGLEGDTIGGFNSMLEKQKKEDGEAVFSTVLFDDKVEILHDRKALEDVAPITDKEYYVRGCTALLDAVGGSIRHIGKLHKSLPEEERPEKTLFIITTDGMENASRKYTYEKVKKMVEKKKEKNGWEFIFMGANIDAAKEAGRFGINANRAVRYENDSMGAELNYSVMSGMITGARKARSAVAMSACYDNNKQLDEIREDYEEFVAMSAATSSHPDYFKVDADVLEANLSSLSGREREIMKQLYGLEGEKKHSYDELARSVRTTVGRIRQIEHRALRKIDKAKV